MLPITAKIRKITPPPLMISCLVSELLARQVDRRRETAVSSIAVPVQ
jgi:hypothetical protein